MSILEAIITSEQNTEKHNDKGFEWALQSLRQKDLTSYIANFNGTQDIVQLDGQTFPFYIPHHLGRDECYLGSIINQYITYGIDEWQLAYGNKWWMEPLRTVATSFFRLTQIDKTIHINANLLSTSFQTSNDTSSYVEVARLIRAMYPNHAVAIRGVHDSPLMGGLKRNGFKQLTNRKIYEVNLEEGLPTKKRPLEQDQKRWNKQTEFSWRPIKCDNKLEMAQIMSMYQAVYRERHSRLNPDYTVAFVKLALKSKWLDGEVMVDTHDRPVGVQLYLEKDGHITTPFIGYDTALPKNTRIYPFLNLRLMHRAKDHGCILNMSSGAGTFKKQRGGMGKIESLMVFTDHLPAFRKLPWQTITFVVNKWVKKYLEENDV